ncbi:3-hydroxyacyl-ACP dehydratase FabZ family protein [Pedobacter sp. Leaf176]|uniref:3-hydroxyacyl-ACP dehydratase FabZ family protein n=1 Tax=Pedobacter sp. Leaf176 TaxID=1736286 RepID=UPI0007022457|nr:3-hydroxyacyl-ACP dehydratase FabZ family protein [Pedobacter sp. Leaf176]KQR65260.1 hydroxymyristoyl-ACP dehydratase [Pedobacter sp. Leaf176]
MEAKEIINKLPYGDAFLFVDDLLHIDENGVKGSYTYAQNLPFYEAHFKTAPVTPAVILTETMAQIGLVCLGLFLLGSYSDEQKISIAMTSNSVDFLRPVYPGETVIVTSEKRYFRFNKLSCRVKMETVSGELICKGTIEGMLISKPDE